MREIKFRSWDGEIMLWIGQKDPSDKYPSQSFPEEEKIMDWDLLFDKDRGVKVMQFTGLHDKNGKEIYEGDILEFEEDDLSFMGASNKVRREVKWQDQYGAGWSFGASWKDGEKRWSFPFWNDMEVIGNIYENPELLKDDQTKKAFDDMMGNPMDKLDNLINK